MSVIDSAGPFEPIPVWNRKGSENEHDRRVPESRIALDDELLGIKV
jgi:hypothetical protein